MIARIKLANRLRTTLLEMEKIQFEISIYKPPHRTQREINEDITYMRQQIRLLTHQRERIKKLIKYSIRAQRAARDRTYQSLLQSLLKGHKPPPYITKS